MPESHNHVRRILQFNDAHPIQGRVELRVVYSIKPKTADDGGAEAQA